ncbi:MAG: glutamine synthetase [Pseudomonadota bacterium]
MPDPAAVADLSNQLAAAGVTTCLATFVDIHGVPKAKAVPLASFEKMCAGSELFTVGAMEGMGLVGPEKDECAVIPDLGSLIILPWDRRIAWFSGDLYYHGEPYPNCSRVILKRVLAQAADQNLGMNLGVETEFYMLRQEEDRLVQPPRERHQGLCPAYDVHQTMQSFDALEPIAKAMDALDWGLYSFDQEGGNGQYEFDFAYADALTMADRVVFFRFMARTLAQRSGLTATFMAKPFAADFRSGAHFNMSLYDLTTGDNLFAGEAGELAGRYAGRAPDVAYHFVAGLLAHASALTAVTCPTHNSYKGLLAQGQMPDSSWAPVLRAYGNNNRSAMLRLPMNRPCVENRAPDMSVNPYLGAAFSLVAGMEGIAAASDPGPPLNDNLYIRLTASSALPELPLEGGGHVARLPRTLLDALQSFERDPLSATVFGQEMKDIYIATKMIEWEREFYDVSQEEFARRLRYV